MRQLLLTIAAVAVLPVTACAQTAAYSDVTFAQQVAREITEVKGGTTPAEWLRAHAGERLQLFNGPQFANDTEQWCARTVVERSTSTDRTWTRSVYFYDPRPPADDALPAPGASGREVLETTPGKSRLAARKKMQGLVPGKKPRVAIKPC